MYHPVSKDLKARIPILRCQGFKVKDICCLLGIKKSLVYQTLAYDRCYGVPYNPHKSRSGRHRTLSHEDLKFILALLNRRHTIYLDEVQVELYNQRGISVS